MTDEQNANVEKDAYDRHTDKVAKDIESGANRDNSKFTGAVSGLVAGGLIGAGLAGGVKALDQEDPRLLAVINVDLNNEGKGVDDAIKIAANPDQLAKARDRANAMSPMQAEYAIELEKHAIKKQQQHEVGLAATVGLVAGGTVGVLGGGLAGITLADARAGNYRRRREEEKKALKANKEVGL